jgi:hypothetical protein
MGHLLGEGRILAGLPRLGRLPADTRRAQDLADRLGADVDHLVLGQVLDQLGQAPGRERPAELVRRGFGHPADRLTNRGAEPRRTAPAPFWVQRREPGLVERANHLPRVLRRRREHPRRLRRKALSVLAGTVRAPELVPAQLDLGDIDLDDIEVDENGAVEETDLKAHIKTRLSLLWTTVLI